ncbi:MAG: ComEC/Rec2 family competence protein [Pseudomonadota bacterium]
MVVGWSKRLKHWASLEAGRFILWAPVCFIVGAGWYFGLTTEPFWQALGVGLALGIALWVWGARRGVGSLLLLGRICTMVALGAVAAQIRTHLVEEPRLYRPMGPVSLTAKVVDVEQQPRAQRLLLEPLDMGALPAHAIPRRIRVSWRGEPGEARAGDKVRVRVMLSPPPEPAVPGGFNYGRQLYFEKIGAVGFAYGAPRVVARPQEKPLKVRIQLWRHAIADRIMRKEGEPSGPILAAIVTGKRERIPDDVTDRLRDTGLAHLLAISGLHMGLVCGYLFFVLRSLFVLHANWAIRFSVKKWAAIGALIGGGIYLILSGGAWSAQRAFIMASIGFIAILFDRRAISLRNVSIAAMIILLWRPEAVLSAGFHMSFAAVVALIAAYELWQFHQEKRRQEGPVYRGKSFLPISFLGGLSMTSLVAGAATSPFAIYHFNRMASYGMIGNMLVMPIFTLIVMPVAVLGLALMPFGFDAPFWWISGKGLEAIIWITGHIASWPGAVAPVAQWPTWAWGASIVGLLGLCLLRGPWRFGFALLFPVAWLGAFASPQPLVHIAEDAKNIGVRTSDGGITLLSRRRERFAVGQWLEGAGLAGAIRDYPRFGECKEPQCWADLAGGGTLVFADTEEAAARGCRNADIVVTPFWHRTYLAQSCEALFFSALSVSQTGPVAIYGRLEGFTVKFAKDGRGLRPWSDAAVSAD